MFNDENKICILEKKIYDRLFMLTQSGKEIKQCDNKDLSKIFETYSCIQLIKEHNKMFYEYEDINPSFKEDNQMTKEDTGIDICDTINTIIQCKMYCSSNSITWEKLGTFFGSQNILNEKGEIIVRWPNMIITRLEESKFSSNMKTRMNLFKNISYNRDEILNYLENIIKNPILLPITIEKRKPYYFQEECKELILNNNVNIIIHLPTGTGKNLIASISLLKNKKYLFLVPRRFLLYQIQDDILLEHPTFKNKIQLIGDGNNTFNSKKNITICVYNSIDKITQFNFEKIVIDEAHHILPPRIYKKNEDEEEKEEDKEEDKEEKEENKEIDQSYIDKIRQLTKYNNNVLLSATIDKHPDYPIFYSKNIREMIEEGFICDYNLVIPVFTHNDVSMEKRAQYLIDNHNQIIIFCKSHIEGKKLTSVMNEYMPNCSEYIDCYTTKKDRDIITKKFKSGKLPFLVNVNILTESFDSPNCKGVCFFSLPSSKTKTLQIIGRALRKFYSKLFASIILPASGENDSRNVNKFLNIIAKNDKRVFDSLSNKKLGGYINIFTCRELKENDKEKDKDEDDIETDIDNSEYLYDIILEKTYDIDFKGKLLLEFVEENKRVPLQKEEYKDIKIGMLWNSIKQGQTKELYDTLLIHNDILKKNYNKTQKIKEDKNEKNILTPKEKCELLLEFVEKNKRVPKNREEYKDNKIGNFFISHIKQGKNKELYDTLLIHNDILRKEYDKTQQIKEDKNGKNILTPKEKCELLLEFVEKNKRVPKNREEYKDNKIGTFYNNIKQGKNKELYNTLLIYNNILKVDYNKTQKIKEDKRGKDILTPKEKCELLLDFVEENKKAPKGKQEYKYITIGIFWANIKQSRHEELYNTLLINNNILKKDYNKTQKIKEDKKKKDN